MTELNDNRPLDPFTRKWLLVVILCMVPTFFLFAVVLGDPGRGRAAAICVGVGMMAIRACWHLRSHEWFWIVLTVMVGLHVALVMFIPWGDKSYPGSALLPVGALDYGIIYGSFKLAEKLMSRGQTTM